MLWITDDDACASALALLDPRLRGLQQRSHAVPAPDDGHGHRVQRHPGGNPGDVEEWGLLGPLMRPAMMEIRRVDPVRGTRGEA